MARTLSQVTAQERTARQAAGALTAAMFKAMQKPALFSGIARTYAPDEENGLQLPPEGTRVQYRVRNALEEFAVALIPALDLSAGKDWANCQAMASIVIDGVVIVADVPVSHLLFLEHQVNDFATFIAALQTRDPAETWTLDPDTGEYRSQMSWTNRFEKREVPLVLHPGSDRHPPQVKSITEDVHVGKWSTVKFSGAISEAEKRQLQDKVLQLKQAIHAARVQADQQVVADHPVGEALFGFLLS